MIKKATIILLLANMLVATIFAQVEEEKKSAFQLSFVPPLSTQGTEAPKYTNAFSFNILAGVSKNVTSFSLSSLGMYVVNDLKGVHISGLATIARNNGGGIMISSLLNRTKDFQGFQLSGLLNMANKTEGFQISGLGNIAKADMEGFQLSGLINTAKHVDGSQMGGLMNISLDVEGFQISSLVNTAKNVEGFQLSGFINVAKDVNGFQIAGLMNIADNNEYPLGLINIIKNNGEMSLGVSYDEIGSTVLSFRSGGRILYGIVGIGFNHKFDNDMVVEAGLGWHIPVSSRFRVNCELMNDHFITMGERTTSYYDGGGSEKVVVNKGIEASHSRLSIMPAFKLLPKWEIFAGPSFNYLESDNIGNESVFPNNSLWKKYTDNKLQQLYFGFSVGTHFIF